MIVDRIEADPVLGDDLETIARRVDDAGADAVVAVEQGVEAAMLANQVEHLRFAQGSARADHFKAALRQQIVMGSRGVLEAGGGQQNFHGGSIGNGRSLRRQESGIYWQRQSGDKSRR